MLNSRRTFVRLRSQTKISSAKFRARANYFGVTVRKNNIGALITQCLYFYLYKFIFLRLKTCGFLPFYSDFFLLSPFPHSAYACTLLARQPTISPQTIRARAKILRITANRKRGVVFTAPLNYYKCVFRRQIAEVGILRIPSFFISVCYLRLLNSRRTFVRLRSQTKISSAKFRARFRRFGCANAQCSALPSAALPYLATRELCDSGDKILRIIAVYDEPRRNGILNLVGTGVPDGPSGVP